MLQLQDALRASQMNGNRQLQPQSRNWPVTDTAGSDGQDELQALERGGVGRHSLVGAMPIAAYAIEYENGRRTCLIGKVSIPWSSPLPRDQLTRAARATTAHPTDGPSGAGSGLS